MSRPPFDPTALSFLPPPRWEDDVDDETEGKDTILVVDDNESVRTLMKRSLIHAGYLVLEASDGQIALELMETKVVNLVLLDVRMPGMDGIELCTELRRRWDSLTLPVVFVTGLADREARVWCKAVGGDEFLTKPMDETELLIRVDNLLRLRRYHRRIVAHNEYLEDMLNQRGEQVHAALSEARQGKALAKRLAGPRQRLAAVVEALGEIAMELPPKVADDSALPGRLLSTVETLDELHSELKSIASQE